MFDLSQRRYTSRLLTFHEAIPPEARSAFQSKATLIHKLSKMLVSPPFRALLRVNFTDEDFISTGSCLLPVNSSLWLLIPGNNHDLLADQTPTTRTI